MAVPGSLPRRMFLLAYDPDKGRFRVGTNLGGLLRAAALADLRLRGHLTDERGNAAIDRRRPRPSGAGTVSRSVHRPPGHDPVLETLLDEIARSKPRTWQFWIHHGLRTAVRAVRQQVSDGGWVRLQPHKVLGLFPTTRVTIRDLRVRNELLGRVNGALNNPIGRVDPADAALVAIVAAGDLRVVLDRRTARAHKRRIKELTELSGPVGPALEQSIRDAAIGESG